MADALVEDFAKCREKQTASISLHKKGRYCQWNALFEQATSNGLVTKSCDILGIPALPFQMQEEQM